MVQETPSPLSEPEEPHGVTVPLPRHPVNYLLIFGVLVVLTILSVVIATHRFEREIVNVLVALLLASIKGACVALFFMHLKFEGKLIYLTLLVPVGLAIVLVCALIPDIAYGYTTAFNDMVGFFSRLMHSMTG